MDEISLTCPSCETVLEISENVSYLSCRQCGKRINLKSQFAYLRGLDAYNEGQEIYHALNPKKRRLIFDQRIQAAVDLFIQAYSSFQVAFQSDLEERQRSLGVKIMTNIAQEFMRREMISPLEVNYWNSLMIEQTAQDECDLLKTRLQNSTGLLGLLKGLRWRLRRKQLAKSLIKIDHKIHQLESAIAFVDVPHARKKNWQF